MSLKLDYKAEQSEHLILHRSPEIQYGGLNADYTKILGVYV